MVLDRQGNFISDLHAEDFEVFENGQKQDVTVFLRGDSFHSTETETNSLNLRLGLLFDTSGSMFEDMGLACSAAIRFLKDFPRPRTSRSSTSTPKCASRSTDQWSCRASSERIRGRRANGWTSLYDALGTLPRWRALTWTAGRCSSSTPTAATRAARRPFADVQAMLKSSDVIVYAIGFMEHQPVQVRNEQKMRAPAARGHHRRRSVFSHHEQGARSGLPAHRTAGARAAAWGSSRPTGRSDGTWRKLDVRLAGSHLQNLQIRTRRGYYAAYSDLPRWESPDRRTDRAQTQSSTLGCEYDWGFGPLSKWPGVSMASADDRFQLVTDFELRGDQARAQ